MAKHLESLYVKNFRCLDELTIDRLGDVNLLVGGNNSGKTTVLEAVQLWASRGNPDTIARIANLYEGINIKEEDEFDSIDYLAAAKALFFDREFSDKDKDGIMVAEKNNLDNVKTLNIYDAFYYEKDDDEFAPTKLMLIGKDKITENISKEIFHSIVIAYKDKDKSTKKLIKRNNTWGITSQLKKIQKPYSIVYTARKNMLHQLDDLFKEGLQVDILSAVNIIDDTIIDLRTIHEKAHVQKKGYKKPFPLQAMGEGVTHILSFVIASAKAKDGILLIDEIENGLHYSIQEKVWNWLFELAKQYNMQIFATTHSWDIVKSFDKIATQWEHKKKEERKEGSLINLGRSQLKKDNDKLLATIYEGEERSSYVSNGWEVR